MQNTSRHQRFVRHLVTVLPAMAATILLAVVPNLRSQPVSINAPVLQILANFGYAVAGFGQDRLLVTAMQIDAGNISSAGEAYLFNVGGSRLATFTNPVPTNGSFFGNAIASVGNNQVIIGASEQTRSISSVIYTNIGEAYLYDTNGTLQMTFTNPVRQGYAFFGEAVAGLGPDRLLIGADGLDSGTNVLVGKAYLYRTDGMLKMIFDNPVTADYSYFGYSLAAVSSNRILISAYGADEGNAIESGRAYLFTTNSGTPLVTFINPAPADYASFGYAVATLDANRVIIGAYGATRSNFANAGEAYLFDINGTRLVTFTNPSPASIINFGATVAAVGTNQVLIGADGTTRGGAESTGEAYLFSTNGTLLATYTNPAPVAFDVFGWSVAAVGTNRILIGAPQVDLGGTNINNGRVYLYAPTGTATSNVSLSLAPNGSDQVLSWVAPDAFVLQETSNLSPPIVWTDATNVVSIRGPTNTAPAFPAQGPPMRFHRLRRL